MKKILAFMFVLTTLFSASAFASQPDPTDFFAGKWKIVVLGTPNGDATFATNLVRKDGVLTGQLKIVGDDSLPAVEISKVEDDSEKVVIYFSTQGYDVNVELTKVDSDNLKGTLMGMFEAKGSRVKE
ncbi:hypothetical protein [Aquirufa regiilacus]|uniref:DUF4488 domain-containing protein n=1 Tax=Aquirufa regiilacus TaxID=3024868 RepID=A0ABU3TU70_9BACT|nr:MULTISPECIES: hypothetical protein [unclassified Aquirufa]MDT8886140.1 hypothetical protein [Aquirufa sp. LEPPI-3A]MDU0809202.1 hypothetical protein [Aquirufa sp. LEOWEIH-7C]